MTKDEFKQLKEGDQFTHPQFSNPITVAKIHTWHEWPDGSGTQPIEVTIAVDTADGRYLKIHDADVQHITKVET